MARIVSEMVSLPSELTDTYIYEALPDARTHLRLLEFETQGIGENGKINCRLTIWPVNRVPTYHAASYTWGSSTETEHIRLNRKQMLVRKNCADVLRRLGHFKTSRYYWIDALCINQDNVEEKNDQVAMMGKIFGEAEHVLACIGLEEEDDAAYAIDQISRVDEHIEYSMESRTNNKAHGSLFLEAEGALMSLGDMDLVRLVLASGALAKRSYFERVWVLQEFLLARQVTICCGYYRVHSDSLHRYVNALWNDHLRGWILREKSRKSAGEEQTDPLEAVFADRDLAALLLLRELLDERLRVSMGELKLSFTVVLRLCDTRRYSDPRDTVYALLPLIDWGDNEPIKSSYERDAYSLAEQVLQCFGHQAFRAGLIRTLKLNTENSKVLSGLETWRYEVGTSNQLFEAAMSPPRYHMIETEYSGYQILSPMDELVLRNEFKIEYSELWSFDEDGSKRLSGLVPSFTKYGDWIVEDSDPNGLVLRWNGTMFIVLGRAWLKDGNALIIDSDFKVLFDPSDLVSDACMHKIA